MRLSAGKLEIRKAGMLRECEAIASKLSGLPAASLLDPFVKVNQQLPITQLGNFESRINRRLTNEI
jgi:hypothetical protein